MYCVQQWPMFKHPQKQNTKTHQKPVLACLGAIPETQSPETPDLLRPTHEIAFETHSTLTSPKTVFCPASRSGLVADCSWLFPWAACLNISSMSWIEERHGREELETSSQDCPHQDGDRKHRELKHILFWISDAAFASFSKLATSIGYFMLFSCNCQENVWSWRFPSARGKQVKRLTFWQKLHSWVTDWPIFDHHQLQLSLAMVVAIQ